MRVPSLRELRHDRPANVVILPTAAPRQVRQHSGRVADRKAHANAARQLADNQPVAFPFKFPGQREAERRAESTRLRPDVPVFDPSNPVHLRAWENLWDYCQRPPQSEGD